MAIMVFFTGAGCPGARSIIKAFRMGARSEKREMEIITADMDPMAYGFHLADRSFRIPAGDSPHFIPSVAGICRSEKPGLLVSAVDKELVPLSRAKGELGKLGVKVVLAEPKAVESAVSKRKSYGIAEKLGLAPEYIKVSDSRGFGEAVKQMGFPKRVVCFKPSFSYGMRGFRVLERGADRSRLLFGEKPGSVLADYQDILNIFREREARGDKLPELMVMEYLPGKEYTVDMLLKDREPVVTIPRERVRTKQGISTIARVEKNQDILRAAEGMAKAMGLDYNANMQFKYSEKGEPKLVEVQPRLAGTTAACIGAGVNLPWLGLKIAMGEPLPEIEVKWGTVMKRFWEEVFEKDGRTWFLGIKDEFG
jgi:carbamoyl-phosphate synthase large subunit